MSTFPVPPGLVQVTQEQFYEALYADKRDIMPNLDSDSFSDWTHTFVAAMGRRGATAIAVETVKSGQLGAPSIGVEIEVDIPSVLNRIGEPEAE